MMDEQPIVKTFDKCPVCGSTERLAGSVAKEQGLENAEIYSLCSYSGPIGDKKKLDTAPIGSKCPFVTAYIDVCSDCGCVYAIRQETSIVIKQLLPPDFNMPGTQLPPGALPGMGPGQKPGFDRFKLPFGKGKG